MTVNDIRQKYISFFETKGHKEIPPAPIVPLNDPSTLFTPFGMQQLVPYLKGEPHSMGKRLVDSQPCFRSEDIDEVGDNRHTTFFEMLGNWSLGDYFKNEQLSWVFEFMTREIGLNPDRLFVTVFEGNDTAPRDNASIAIWQELFKTKVPARAGLLGFDPETKIYTYEASKNWWSRAGTPEKMPIGEIGGPDSEMFYDFGAELKLHEKSIYKSKPCHVNCDCGRFLEFGNSVFMEYIKEADGSFEPLPAKNVDFGGGLERIVAAVQNKSDVFTTDLFSTIIEAVEKATNKTYAEQANQPAMRVAADHMKAAVFLIEGGVIPGNKMQGYYLRRILRRTMVKMQKLGGEITRVLDDSFYTQIIMAVIETYTPIYFKAGFDPGEIIGIIREERERFAKTLNRGLKLIQNQLPAEINGSFAFDLFQSYGFPLEITQELLTERGITIDKDQFAREFERHREKSRTASAGIFKGGLADQSETVTKYHTATHLLHQALRQILGPHVEQMGSNITNERLRFDFKHPAKLSETEKERVIQLVNQKIAENLPVHKTIENKASALKSGAMAFFREKYPDQVSVYTIGLKPKSGWFSKELCGGPHVTSTGMIGPVRMKKEEAVGAGVRRVYLVLDSSLLS